MNNNYINELKNNCDRITNIYNELKNKNNKKKLNSLILNTAFDTEKTSINDKIELYHDTEKEIISQLDAISNCNAYENIINKYSLSKQVLDKNEIVMNGGTVDNYLLFSETSSTKFKNNDYFIANNIDNSNYYYIN